MEYAIRTENLSKTYGKTFKALDSVSLQVSRGEVVGYVGPNGAGKTTTIKILTGLIRPTSGRAHVNDRDVVSNPRDALRSMGALIEVPGVYDYLTPHEMLTYFGRVYGMRRDVIDQRIKETLELVRLPDWEHKKTGAFSTGMLRRLAIAKAVLHRPDILILDEPVLGLDPKGIMEVREMIRQFRSEGMTVFLSSHLLSEVAEVCDSVIFLDKGKVVTSDSVEGIGRRVGHAVVDARFLHPLSPEEIGKLKDIDLIKGVDMKNSTARLQYDGTPETSAQILRLLVSLNLDVVSYAAEGVGLEEYYVSVMSDEKGVN
ncbi:MAG: ABC transporter ATP-binding protein [Dehalococcoidia bacterium]|nr:ABC transporter ATP-binding protein [Dehalococcoidia bacterium]